MKFAIVALNSGPRGYNFKVEDQRMKSRSGRNLKENRNTLLCNSKLNKQRELSIIQPNEHLDAFSIVKKVFHG